MRPCLIFVLCAVPALGGSAGADRRVALPETVAPGAELIKIYDGRDFYEGPVWDPESGRLYFAAFNTSSHVLRLDEPGRSFRWFAHSSGVNGMCMSRDGRLLAAQAVKHRIVSYVVGRGGPEDERVLAESDDWHQPNDLCEAPNGNIYFTDPELKRNADSGVYLLTPAGDCHRIISDMPAPNGVETSPDGKTLYVSDSDALIWKSYPIREDGAVEAGKVFFSPETYDRTPPDGMTLDERGNLYLTGRGGVWVVTPDGKSLGLIPFREFASNCAFGGRDGKTLFITCTRKVYSLKMQVRGAQFADAAR